MPAVNPNSLQDLVGQLFVAPFDDTGNLTRLASVRGLTAIVDTTANQVEIMADDTQTILRGNTPEFRVEGSFLEIMDADVMALLLNGTKTVIPAALVAGATMTLLEGSWGFNNPILVENQNGDGTPLTINSVTGSEDGALTVDVDYFVGTDAHGRTIVTVIDGTNVTDDEQDIVIDYDYTPAERNDVKMDAVFQQNRRLFVRIVATDTQGRLRVIELEDATFEATYNIPFLDVQQAGDMEGTEFVFRAASGTSMTVRDEVL